jgi:hypothetical protein
MTLTLRDGIARRIFSAARLEERKATLAKSASRNIF